jgi:hypothetical protein
MAYDEARQRTVLFGGFDPAMGERYYGDTWTWDGTARSQEAVIGPEARRQAAMTYDAGRKTVVLFGGESLLEWDSSVWEWDGLQWTVRGMPLPRWRARHGLACDTARNEIVLYGGSSLDTEGRPIILRDTWLLSLQETWVDFAYRGQDESGTFSSPFNTLAEGVAAVPAGATLRIKAGSTAETPTLTKPMSIIAYGGPVILGHP